MESIFDISEYIAFLNNRKDEKLISSIYDIETFETRIEIPKSFEEKIFGYITGQKRENADESEVEEVLQKVRNQKILKVINRWTYESALYNYLRALRPGVNIKDSKKQEAWFKSNIEGTKDNCDFCEPEKYTPEDSFGRIYGKHCITAANLARFDRFHSLLIFKRHNPLDFSEDEFSDYIDTAFKWFERIKGISPEHSYSLLIWNCLPRAGASQIHGHMQMLASKTIYPKMAQLLSTAKKYKENMGIDYFEALYNIHNILGLSIDKKNLKVLFYITPVKEKEVFIIADSIDSNFKIFIYQTLRKLIDELKVFSFNFSLYKIPISGKKNVIYFARIVDRGNILSKTSDIASMELYASSVIANDPVKLKKLLD